MTRFVYKPLFDSSANIDLVSLSEKFTNLLALDSLTLNVSDVNLYEVISSEI